MANGSRTNKSSCNTRRNILHTFLTIVLIMEPLNSMASGETETCTLDTIKDLGIVFQPPTKPNGYTKSELSDLAKNVSTRFHKISTYSSGVTLADYTKRAKSSAPNDTLDIGVIPFVLANLNKASHTLKTTLMVGSPIPKFDPGALKESEFAKQVLDVTTHIYNGTVTTIIWTYPQDDLTTLPALAGIIQLARATYPHLKFALRTSSCHSVLETATTDPTWKKSVENLDFLICQTFIVKVQDAKKAANETTKHWEHFQKKLNELKLNTTLVGETGWPSTPNLNEKEKKKAVERMEQYWCQMGIWSKKSKVDVYMVGAFDQPESNEKGGADAYGKGQMGLWTVNRTVLVEKVKFPVPAPAPAPEASGAQSMRTRLSLMSFLAISVISKFQ